MVVVAQLVRAPDCGSGGRRFETDLPPSIKIRVDVKLTLILYPLVYQLVYPIRFLISIICCSKLLFIYLYIQQLYIHYLLRKILNLKAFAAIPKILMGILTVHTLNNFSLFGLSGGK